MTLINWADRFTSVKKTEKANTSDWTAECITESHQKVMHLFLFLLLFLCIFLPLLPLSKSLPSESDHLFVASAE